ncbi:MAG: sialidase family protein [Gammaproteobacteria bacterium]|nr:sialidase family protein [Gammaproteobacteria bacterium]
MSVGANDTVVLSWLDSEDHEVVLRYAELTPGGWTPPRKVASGDDWFVNWADFPSVVRLSEDRWAAHWLRSQPAGGYAYDVWVALSSDGGAHWSEGVKPHRDGTATEHGFVSLNARGDDLNVIWLDGRDMAQAPETGAMALRSATIGDDMQLGREQVVDELVCDCCQTDSVQTTDGMVVAYRDRSAMEIRDISVVRLTNATWSAPLTVSRDGWHIAGCPVNGPAIDVNGDELVVAWYTQIDERPTVRLARSLDFGRSFLPAIDIDDGAPLGRVGVTVLTDGTAVVSWLRSVSGSTTMSLRMVDTQGNLGDVYDLAEVSATRATGFPQLVSIGDALIVAWTDAQGRSSQVRSARLPVSALLD